MSYNALDWYWRVPPDTVVWSSARLKYVPTTDALFQVWVAAGNSVTITDRASLSTNMTSTVVPNYLGTGLEVTFSLTPALSSNYALDAVTLEQVGDVARDVASGLGFPGSAATFSYPDTSGTPHSFAPPQFTALYQALRDYVALVNMTVAALVFQIPGAVLPPSTATVTA